MEVFFEDDGWYAGPSVRDEMVSRAEAELGVRLPRSYVDLLRVQNGGRPRRRCLRTTFATSWGPNHIEVEIIYGIGGEWGIDSSSGIGGSNYLIAEWDFPRIGVVIGDTPSAGEEVLMLDYSTVGSHGEPSVAHIAEDRIPRTVAETFEAFLAQLEPCAAFEQQLAEAFGDD